jgi:16S rRNA (uracil1498-N3)-methyltransferase
VSGFCPRFFAVSPGDLDPVCGSLTGTELTLDADDSYHALRVLRMKPGGDCEVVVGAAVYAATVVRVGSGAPVGAGSAVGGAPTGAPRGAGQGGAVTVRLGGCLTGRDAGAIYRYQVGLVQAVARPSALDWSIEKSTEAGASFILLLQAGGSPQWSCKDTRTRLARWSRIAREAAKQSKQPAVPLVDFVATPAAALERVGFWAAVSLLLDPAAETTVYDFLGAWRTSASTQVPGRGGVALWVGPESGWTGEERDYLLEAGLNAVRLGRGVLRTETAGPVATAVARLALGDW